jgi:hypothetical protein
MAEQAENANGLPTDCGRKDSQRSSSAVGLYCQIMIEEQLNTVVIKVGARPVKPNRRSPCSLRRERLQTRGTRRSARSALARPDQKQDGSPSLCRRAAVDDEPRAGHEAGIVGGEKDDALGNVLRHAEPADRVPRHGLRAHRIHVIGAEVARPADKGLLAHVGLDQTPRERVVRPTTKKGGSSGKD